MSTPLAITLEPNSPQKYGFAANFSNAFVNAELTSGQGDVLTTLSVHYYNNLTLLWSTVVKEKNITIGDPTITLLLPGYVANNNKSMISLTTDAFSTLDVSIASPVPTGDDSFSIFPIEDEKQCYRKDKDNTWWIWFLVILIIIFMIYVAYH